MKNLTIDPIRLIRQDTTRAELPPCMTPPKVVVRNEEVLGTLGSIEIVRERYVSVDFGDLVLNKTDEPFIVSREVFDALPPDRIEFITPDFDTSIRNAFGAPHVIRRFIAKAGATYRAPQPATQQEK